MCIKKARRAFAKSYMKKIIALGAFFAPFVASAQAAPGSNVNALISWFHALIKSLPPIILTLAVVYFFWNVAKYVLASGDEEKRKEGQQGIVYGIIGITVMVSIWGLVTFLTSTAGFGATTITAPQVF